MKSNTAAVSHNGELSGRLGIIYYFLTVFLRNENKIDNWKNK